MNRQPLTTQVAAGLWVGACVCAVLLTFGLDSPAFAAEVPKFALLVGVQEYPNLGDSEQLDGCANDVKVVRQMMQQLFGFRDDQIVTLVNREATGAAMRAELKALADQVRNLPADAPPAQVFFHFSGHGSQVLDQPEGEDRDELDGLDETLVPYDATRQGGSEDIRDDELYEFVEDICGDGRAKMWLVLDCCHSGSGARGVTKVRKLHRAAIEVDLPAEGSRKPVSKKLPKGAVALSACRAREVEPEYRQSGQSYGLLTRFLTQLLNEEENLSKLSYDLLRQSLIARYRQDPTVIQPPTPMLEGDAELLRGGVLGSAGIDRKPYWPVQSSGSQLGNLLIKAGAFHGVTKGSIYELYEQPDQIDFAGTLAAKTGNGDSLGWLRVESVEGATAQASFFRWDDGEQIDEQAPASFKSGFAVERHRQHGDFGVSLRVVHAEDESRDSPPLRAGDKQVHPTIAKALGSINHADESQWLHWVGADETCDLLLRIDGDYAALFPATGVAHVAETSADNRKEVPRSLVGGWGPIDLRKPEEAAKQLRDHLRRITRARNLLRIAALDGERRSEDSSIQVDLELIKVESFEDDGFTVKKWRTWTADNDANIMRDLDTYAFRVANRQTSGKPIYVSVLLIDSDMGIQQILPWQDGAELVGEQQLAPGQSRITDAFDCNGDAYLEDPREREPPVYGPRWAIVMATNEPNDFYMLQQPGLPKTRSADRNNRSLNELLMEQTYFQTRGRDRRRRPPKLFDESWGTATIQWLAVPRK